MPRYTVIIATHDRPALLARAIRSVKSQPFPGATVTVVSDDHSIETHNVARALLSDDDIYIERQGNPGPARSRTLGLGVTNSEYVMFLDDDDEFSENFLMALDCHTKAALNSVIFCDFYVSNDGEDRTAAGPGPPIPVTIGDRDPRDIHVRNYIPNSCLIYPIDAVRNKNFDESFVLNEDWDFLLDVMRTRPLLHVPIFGPIIHKTDRSREDRRGAVNDHLLPDNTLRIYKKWPAPTATLRQARQRLFASVGVALPIEHF